MTDLTSQTTFEILAAAEEFEETADLILLPENAGEEAMRELHYPNDALPAIIYEELPDKWENFDSVPLTPRPTLKVEATLAGNKLARWPGYLADKSIREIWSGDASKSRMTLGHLRRLLEYYLNPPSSGYITWYPKDRTTTGYQIEIESVTVGGTDAVSLDYYGVYAGYVLGEVIFAFRIVSEVA